VIDETLPHLAAHKHSIVVELASIRAPSAATVTEGSALNATKAKEVEVVARIAADKPAEARPVGLGTSGGRHAGSAV
jgi:hypothetical protein